MKTIYFEDSESRWKTITYKNDEYKNVQEKNPLYLEFALRLASGDLVEFENEEDDVVINLKTKVHWHWKCDHFFVIAWKISISWSILGHIIILYKLKFKMTKEWDECCMYISVYIIIYILVGLLALL